MKIAVVDANIFIDLIRLKLLDDFFQIGLEIHTSDFVFNQLNESQQEILQGKIQGGIIVLHELSASDLTELMDMPFPRKLEIADQTVFYFARKLNGMLLSGDNCLRRHCQTQNLEVHGLVWIFEQLFKREIVGTKVLRTKIDLYLKYAQRAPRNEFVALRDGMI